MNTPVIFALHNMTIALLAAASLRAKNQPADRAYYNEICKQLKILIEHQVLNKRQAEALAKQLVRRGRRTIKNDMTVLLMKMLNISEQFHKLQTLIEYNIFKPEEMEFAIYMAVNDVIDVEAVMPHTWRSLAVRKMTVATLLKYVTAH